MIRGINKRTTSLDSPGNQRLERDAFHSQLNLAAGNARDVQKVIDQSDHMADLTFHHCAATFNC